MLISFERTEMRHKGIHLFLSLENLLRIQVVCAGHRHIDTHATLDGGILEMCLYAGHGLFNHETQREKKG